MRREWKHVTNKLTFRIHEQLVLASANLPRNQKQAIRNLGSTQILKTQIFVPFFDDRHPFIGIAFPHQRLGDIGSTFDPFKFIPRPGFSADDYQKEQDHSNIEYSRILAQVFEIEQQAGLVEFGAGERDADLVVMAVRILALALVVAQVMSRGKSIVNRNFEHVPLSGPAQVMTGPRSIAKHLLYRSPPQSRLTGASPNCSLPIRLLSAKERLCRAATAF